MHQLTLAVNILEQRQFSDFEKQGIIPEFEFPHELAWNVLKDYLEYEGIHGLIVSRCTVPEAFKRGLIIDISTIHATYHPKFMAMQGFRGKEV